MDLYFKEITKKYQLSTDTFCQTCDLLPKYTTDMEKFSKYWKTVNQSLNEYLVNNTTNIITGYLSNTSEICHFCEMIHVIEDIIRKNIIEHTVHYINEEDMSQTHFIEKHEVKKYVVLKFGYQTIKTETILSDADIYKLLVRIGIIEPTGYRFIGCGCGGGPVGPIGATGSEGPVGPDAIGFGRTAYVSIPCSNPFRLKTSIIKMRGNHHKMSHR